MSSRGDRAQAYFDMMRSRISCCGLLRVPDVQYLDVQVRDGGQNNANVNNVLIVVYPRLTLLQRANPPVAPVMQGWTDRYGAIILRVPAGNYTVKTYKEWYAPEVDWQDVDLNARSNTAVRFNMHHLRVYLHVDANRDGVIDDWPESIDMAAPAWAWGENNRGAIIPVNVDDDDANDQLDAADGNVNGANDRDSDIAHIQFRRHGGNNPVPATWTAALSIASPAGEPNPENHIRVFNDTAAASNQLAGPGAPNVNVTAHLANNGIYGVEGIHYAGAGFNGIVSLRLTVSRPNGFGGQSSYMSEAQLRMASWLIPNHLDRADTVFVSNLGVAQSTAFIAAINPFVTNAAPAGAGAVLNEYRGLPPGFNLDDRWMQDCMEIGYSTWPGTGNGIKRMESVMKALRERELQNMPGTLLGQSFGFSFPGQGGAVNDYNSGGNIEVTPPVRSSAGAINGARDYPWGRIYYGPGRGNIFNGNTLDFFQGQVVQSPIALNTNWLEVGHVDEMISFIPAPDNNQPWNKQWKLIIASPRAAYGIIAHVALATPAAVVMNGRSLDLGAGNVAVNTTTGVMMNAANSPIPNPQGGVLTWQQLRDWNLGPVQTVLDNVRDTLVDEIDLTIATDVIEVPVVFMPVGILIGGGVGTNPLLTEPGRPGGYLCGALTADMVNMLVINNQLLIPKPFGPENPLGIDLFEADYTNKLNAANPNLVPRYVDDWDLYHALEGEIHCGTNTLRKPAAGADMNNWLTSNAAKWWHYPG